MKSIVTILCLVSITFYNPFVFGLLFGRLLFTLQFTAIFDEHFVTIKCNRIFVQSMQFGFSISGGQHSLMMGERKEKKKLSDAGSHSVILDVEYDFNITHITTKP